MPAGNLSRTQAASLSAGTKRIRYLDENLAAADLALSAAEVATLQQIFDPQVIRGEPYPNISFMR